MQMISEAIVNGSLQALSESLAEEKSRVENGTANRAERRRQQAIDRKEAKKERRAKAARAVAE